jgi:hypothetical protein
MVDFIRLLILRNLIKLSYLIAWIEGFAIFMGVFIVATVGSFNDWQKEKQFLRLQAESEKDNTVSEYNYIIGQGLDARILSFLRIYPCMLS